MDIEYNSHNSKAQIHKVMTKSKATKENETQPNV